jgi:hypothetical protein
MKLESVFLRVLRLLSVISLHQSSTLISFHLLEHCINLAIYSVGRKTLRSKMFLYLEIALLKSVIKGQVSNGLQLLLTNTLALEYQNQTPHTCFSPFHSHPFLRTYTFKIRLPFGLFPGDFSSIHLHMSWHPSYLEFWEITTGNVASSTSGYVWSPCYA